MSSKTSKKDAVAVQTLPAESDVSLTGQSTNSDSNVKAPWWSYLWDYEPGRSKEERTFVQRLDISVLVILSLGYFIKNLAQSNISNVSMPLTILTGPD